ncbi:unnamed protein product [Closterium sp. NIES-54]
MALRPSSVPHRVVLPEPQASSLPHVLDPEYNLAHAASSTVTRLVATVIDPEFESTTALALVTELVDFAARSHHDYVASLVTESESVCPPSVRDEPALSSDVFEDRQFDLECLAAALPRFASMLLCPEGDPDALDIPTTRSYAEAIAGEYSSQWQAAMDVEMASWKSTGTYVDEVPPLRANIGVDFFWTFSPIPKMTTLRVLLHVAAQRDYELHSLGFSTAFLQGSLHGEIWLRHPPGITGSTVEPLVAILWSLPCASRVARHTEDYTCGTWVFSFLCRPVLQRFGFQFSSPHPTPLSTGHLLSAPPSNESVEPSGPYLELVGCLIGEAEIYAGAITALELRWLTYMLTDLGERTRSSLVLVRALLPCASHPATACPSRPAALHVAPCCNPRIELCCSARRALLQPVCHTLLPRASPPATARASCPASPLVAPCCPAQRTPYCPRRPDRAAPPSPSRHHATTAAATARATAAAGGGAAGSAGGAAGSARGAAGAGGAGGATGSTRDAAGAGGAGPTTDRHCLSWPLSWQLQWLGVDSSDHCLSRMTPRLTSFVKASALGSSDSAAAPGASESTAALGACESADALGASASTATGPASAEALHTFTLDSGASRCFFRDCTTVTPLATPVPVSLADPAGGPVVARASTVLPCPPVPSGSL